MVTEGQRVGHRVLTAILDELPNDAVRRLACTAPAFDAGREYRGMLLKLLMAILSIYEFAAFDKAVTNAAVNCGLGNDKFSEVFGRLFGFGPSKFRSYCQIAKAKRLLKQGRTVEEAAHSVGFAASESFSIRFKELVGEPPTAWLKREQAPNSSPDGDKPPADPNVPGAVQIFG